MEKFSDVSVQSVYKNNPVFENLTPKQPTSRRPKLRNSEPRHPEVRHNSEKKPETKKLTPAGFTKDGQPLYNCERIKLNFKVNPYSLYQI